MAILRVVRLCLPGPRLAIPHGLTALPLLAGRSWVPGGRVFRPYWRRHRAGSVTGKDPSKELHAMTSHVSDVMTRNVIALRRHAEFKEILQVLRARQFSAFPVLDEDDRVVGVVSEEDLLVREAYSEPERARRGFRHRSDRVKATSLTAGELMSKPAITIGPEASVAEAASLLHARHVRRLPVVTRDGHLAGIVSRTDLLGVYDRPDENIRQEIVCQVIGSEFMLEKLAFTVTVAAGIVTVSGPVESEAVALSLLDDIRNVAGVVAVRDRLHYPQAWTAGLAWPVQLASEPDSRKLNSRKLNSRKETRRV